MDNDYDPLVILNHKPIIWKKEYSLWNQYYQGRAGNQFKEYLPCHYKKQETNIISS